MCHINKLYSLSEEEEEEEEEEEDESTDTIHCGTRGIILIIKKLSVCMALIILFEGILSSAQLFVFSNILKHKVLILACIFLFYS